MITEMDLPEAEIEELTVPFPLTNEDLDAEEDGWWNTSATQKPRKEDCE